MREATEEGWYTDPYGRHDARWMSDGKATKLVRDGEKESFDAPPDEPPTRTPVRVVSGHCRSDDLRRADDAERDGTYDQANQTAFDIFDLHSRP